MANKREIRKLADCLTLKITKTVKILAPKNLLEGKVCQFFNGFFSNGMGSRLPHPQGVYLPWKERFCTFLQMMLPQNPGLHASQIVSNLPMTNSSIRHHWKISATENYLGMPKPPNPKRPKSLVDLEGKFPTFSYQFRHADFAKRKCSSSKVVNTASLQNLKMQLEQSTLQSRAVFLYFNVIIKLTVK